MIENILVIGPGSMVGSRFVELMAEKGVKIYGAGGEMDNGQNETLVDFKRLDVTDETQVKSVINSFPGQYLINFAGLTAVEDIEKTRDQGEESLAYKVNVLGTRNIILACRESGKIPIFISTESVFDGQNGPYSEDDEIAQSSEGMSFYGWTKALAEKEAQESGIPFIVVRISYPYRKEYSLKGDFARNFLKLYDNNSLYPIFDKQTLTPTFIDDLPEAVLLLTDKKAEGVYHVTSPEVTTPYDFCCGLLKVARGVEDPEQLVKRGSIVEFQKKHPELAKRPIKGALSTDKIIELGFTPTSWEKGILIYKTPAGAGKD